MTQISRVRSVDGVPPPTGPWNWSVTRDDLVFVSGVRGIDLATGLPAETNEIRIELIFRHIANILAAAGSSLDRVLATTVYVTDMKRLRPLVNDAYERAFGPNLPTRTIVQVVALNQDDSIEIEVVASRRENGHENS